MGEEPKKEPAAAKPEEKKEEEEKGEEKKEEPKPPSPFVLYVDLHCVGCAKKIEKSLLNITGVEGVVIDMALNQVTIKGVVEPQVVCTKIMKKTKRKARVVLSSPLPAAGEVVNSQVSELTTVELNVHMHCEACAEQLKRKILKMRGVSTATTDPGSGKVSVTGTMDANRLVDYVYRRTKKQAKIVPQPEPEKPEAAEANKKKKPEEEKEKAAGEEPKPEDQKKEEGGDKKPPAEEEGKKEGNINEEEAKKEVGEEDDDQQSIHMNASTDHEQTMPRMKHYNYQPLYFIERIPPPQLFSDENPNACRIT